eukprot:GHUV01055589.1.p1 GENE.GHUV01055589.1~~GHUV01055589.1.p1  ORF type:complete len:247 (+),score=23.26 GHUV01055589.1:79-819(+)
MDKAYLPIVTISGKSIHCCSNPHRALQAIKGPQISPALRTLDDLPCLMDSPSGWARSLSPQQQAEWLVDCYRIRLDDEYENKAMSGQFGRDGIKTRGLYDSNFHFPEEAKSTIAEDFLIFCKLAVQRAVIPPSWALFLDTAARLLPHIFEREDCTEKWGYEFVMHSPLLGRSLKHTGALIYAGVEGDSGKLYNKLRTRVLRNWKTLIEGGKKLGPEYFDDVGGVELWKQLHSDMVIVQYGMGTARS